MRSMKIECRMAFCYLPDRHTCVPGSFIDLQFYRHRRPYREELHAPHTVRCVVSSLIAGSRVTMLGSTALTSPHDSASGEAGQSRQSPYALMERTHRTAPRRVCRVAPHARGTRTKCHAEARYGLYAMPCLAPLDVLSILSALASCLVCI